MLISLQCQVYVEDWSAVLSHKHHNFQQLLQPIRADLFSFVNFSPRVSPLLQLWPWQECLVTAQIPSLSGRCRSPLKTSAEECFSDLCFGKFYVSRYGCVKLLFQALPSKSQDFWGGKRQLIPQ